MKWNRNDLGKEDGEEMLKKSEEEG